MNSGRSAILTGAACLLLSAVIAILGVVSSQGGLLALGLVLLAFAIAFLAYAVAIRRRIAHAELTDDPQGEYRHILVPLKWSPIGDEILIAALRLAEEQKAKVTVLHVIQVPHARALDAPCAEDADSAHHISDAKTAAADVGVAIEVETLHARSRGNAICDAAVRLGCDLIVMGSSPRWRRQSRIISPAADYVVRNAPCQVMVVSYPDGAFADSTPTDTAFVDSTSS